MSCCRRLAVVVLLSLAAGTLRAQSSTAHVDPAWLPVEPIAAALEDHNNDTIPDRLQKLIHVRGVVTIGSDTLSNDRMNLYIQDGSGGIEIFSRHAPEQPIAPGDVIDVIGRIDQYRGSVQLANPKYEIVGHQALPTAMKMRAGSASHWESYGRRVEVEGVIGAPESRGPYIGMPLKGDDGAEIDLLLAPKLVGSVRLARFPRGSHVIATGVVSIYSMDIPYRKGFFLYVTTPDALRLVHPPTPAWMGYAAGAIAIALLALVSFLIIRRIVARRAEMRRRGVAVLNELSSTIATAKDLDSLFAAGLLIMSRHGLIDGAVVHLVEHSSLELRATHGVDKEETLAIDAEVQSHVARELAGKHPSGSFSMHTAKLRQLVSVPLQGRSRTIGVLSAFTALRRIPSMEETSTIAAAANVIALGIENIQVLAQAEQRELDLKQLAITDPLTGLYNRRFLDEYLRIHTAMAKRQGAPVSFIAIDLDHFKDVNDTFGHSAGDDLLAEVGKMIRRMTRASDLPVRFGGEEFLVVMSDSDQAGAVSFAERLRKEFHEVDFAPLGMPAGFRLTASFGVAVYPENGETERELLRVVDEALYQSKRAGRDCITVAPRRLRVVESHHRDLP